MTTPLAERLRKLSPQLDMLACEDVLQAAAELDRLTKERDELQRTFDLQWTRMGEATERWRAEDPKKRELILPDLGDLLHWLMTRADLAEIYQQDAERDLAAAREAIKGLFAGGFTEADMREQSEWAQELKRRLKPLRTALAATEPSNG